MTIAQEWGCRNNMKHTQVCESEFDSSTSMEFEVDDSMVSEVEDTSTFETNYFWDNWAPREFNIKGMSLREAFRVLSSKFEDFEDEYRHPWVSIEIIK